MRYLGKVICTAMTVSVLATGVWSAGAGGTNRETLVEEGAKDAGIFAVINGQAVKKALAEMMLRERAGTAEAHDATLSGNVDDLLITNELFVQEAVKRGIDKQQDVVVKAEMLRRDLLANVFLQAYFREHPVSDDAVKAEYERRKVPLAGAREFSVRHILLRDRQAAEEVIVQLQGGTDFTNLVDRYSLDEGPSRNYGGSLGWISIDNSESALIQAVSDLKNGEVAAQPVQTRFGWHVVRLDDARDIQILPFDAVKERLRQQLQQVQAEQLGRELRAQAKIVRPGEPLANSKSNLNTNRSDNVVESFNRM